MKKQNIILIFVLALSLCNTAFAAAPTYSYSKSDGQTLDIVVFDSLITIRFDTTSISGPDELAAQYACLVDDFDFIQLSGNFYVFKAEPDRDLAETLALLRADSNVFMVNPVIKTQSGKAIYLTNQIVARYKPEISLDEIDSINAAFGLNIYRTLGDYYPCYFLEFNDKTELNIFDISQSLLTTGFLKHTYPNFVYSDIFHSTPQDPYFNYQWHLHNTGQTGGSADCDIDMPEAWDVRPDSVNGNRVILAILDSGFEMDHEDLPNGWSRFPYDAVGRYDFDPHPDSDPSNECDGILDQCIHGTMVLGMVIPLINNEIGIAGIEDSIKIMPIKITGLYNRPSSEACIAGFYHARTALERPEVYSCSWGDLSLLDEELESELE